MDKRLIKTHLSSYPTDKNVFIGIFSFLVLLSIYLFSGSELKASGVMIFEQGQWWKAFTTSLMHADLIHLGHNALFFIIFSILLNTYFGFWVFPVLSLFIGGIVNIITLYFYPKEITLVGISGVIYFMASFWMTSYFLIERKLPWQKRLIIVTGICLALFCPNIFQLEEKVSYLSHAIGFTLGIPSAALWFKLNKSAIRNQEVWIDRAPVNFDWEETENY